MGKAKKKRGRPPKPAAERRTLAVFLKVTPAEKAAIDEAGTAATAGTNSSPTDWARGVLLRAARRITRHV